VFKIEHFANVNTPGVSEDATVRITNPGSTGLRAWGTHVEVPGGSVGNFITETPFQNATLSDAELSVLADKCGDIQDNGSGFGVCTCPEETNDTDPDPTGTLCALIYVFSADQQLAECCGCPVTPNGLLTLSVTHDLTSNSLTGDTLHTGVIKILSSIGEEPHDAVHVEEIGETGICDPAAPHLPTAPTTTTSTSTTTTSTTSAGSTSTTARSTTSTTSAGSTSTTAGSTTSTTATSTTSTTHSVSGAFTTDTGGTAASGCQAQSGFDRLDCELQAMTDPLCTTGSIRPSLQRLVLRKLHALQRHLERAHGKGGEAFTRTLTRTEAALSTLQQRLRSAKPRRIAPSCQAALAQQIASLRGEVAALRQ
jgi:hypothetical protein